MPTSKWVGVCLRHRVASFGGGLPLPLTLPGAPDTCWQVFGTTSTALEKMVRHQSPFGHLKGWKLAHFIVKAGDDFRMEALAMQVRMYVGAS